MKNSTEDETKYYNEEDEELPNKSKFIRFKDRSGKWSDIEPLPQFSEDVEILKIDYDPATKELNDYFRAILHKNEISERAYELTKEVITVSLKQLNISSGIRHKLHGLVSSTTLY